MSDVSEQELLDRLDAAEAELGRLRAALQKIINISPPYPSYPLSLSRVNKIAQEALDG